MKVNLTNQVDVNKALLSQQHVLRTKYDDAIEVNQEVQNKQKILSAEIEKLHEAIHHLCPTKPLPVVDIIGKAPLAIPTVTAVASPNPMLSSTPPPQLITSRTMTVPTAAALKMGVGFPLTSLRKDDTGRILSTQCIANDELLNDCGICKKCTEQHLLAKCDTCHLYYHLGCLNPPLSRHPKRSKLYLWQCSECDKSDDSAPENVIIPKGPRRSRVRYSKEGIFPDPLRDSLGSEKSLALSRKSDESHQRTVNGSESEIIQENAEVKKTKTKKAKDTKLVTSSAEPVNDSIIAECVPTTSTPISDKITVKEEKSSPKKRGRKPKPKPDLSIVPSTATATTVSSDLSQSTPSKENCSENYVKPGSNSFSQSDMVISKVDLIESSRFPDLSKTLSEPPKKKGRPRKEKPSITQISNNLQKKHENIEKLAMEPKAEFLDSCPVDINRPFADIPNSIPYPAPVIECPKISDPNEQLPIFPAATHPIVPIKNGTSEPLLNGAFTNGEGTTSSGSGHHKHKKQKSRKRRHSHSPSSGERLPSGKKHKKKRKHKTHDLEEAPALEPLSTEQPRLPEQPRIKMKLCLKFVQAGDDKKKMWSLPELVDPVQGTSSEDVVACVNEVKLMCLRIHHANVLSIF